MVHRRDLYHRPDAFRVGRAALERHATQSESQSHTLTCDDTHLGTCTLQVPQQRSGLFVLCSAQIVTRQLYLVMPCIDRTLYTRYWYDTRRLVPCRDFHMKLKMKKCCETGENEG